LSGLNRAVLGQRAGALGAAIRRAQTGKAADKLSSSGQLGSGLVRGHGGGLAQCLQQALSAPSVGVAILDPSARGDLKSALCHRFLRRLLLDQVR